MEYFKHSEYGVKEVGLVQETSEHGAGKNI